MGDMNIPFMKVVAGLKWNSLTNSKTFPSWGPKVQIDFILSQSLTAEDVRHNPFAHAGMSDHLALQIEISTK
jgi:endonuclease/exonuclease/phosphatase family metal-dependent hydrolase